jgi:acetyltransferase-like isoleucine patch superfamily enzyme
MTKLEKLFNDPIAMLFVKARVWTNEVYQWWCSVTNYLIAGLKGIRMVNMPRCTGRPYFLRVPGSSIRLGRNCLLNSSFKSNNIGIGRRTLISTNAAGARIEIGDNVGMSSATISAFQHISIGSDTLLGGNVLITDSDWHPIDPELRHDSSHKRCAPVHIGHNVFIGTRSIVLKGSKIGDNSVIGAGSVVCGEIPANVIAAGNPCRVIRSIQH